MPILLSLVLALLLSWYGGSAIKKHAPVFYGGAALLALTTIAVTWSGADASFPGWMSNYVWPLLSHGAFASALFIIVMYMGALPNGTKAIKRLMPIRAELSIMASLLVLGHNIAYGRTYFVRLFTDTSKMSTTQTLAAICSLIMIAIMLPLMITSFRAVRKKMKPKSWKKLQRSAYVFYGLIYVHTMLLYVPMVQAGRSVYIVNVSVYSLIFISYAGMRIRKELLKKKRGASCILPVAAVVCVAACVLGCIPLSALSPTEEPVVPAASVDNAEGDSDGKAYAASEVHYADGTHIGTGEGYNGTITVAVRIADGQITGVTVVSTSDDGSYWQSATAIIDEVVEKQSTDVDSVSGATYSSKGLKEAISNALATAVIDG